MSKQKRALVTGANGQDASYLMEFLLSKGYEVHGMIRRSSTSNISRIRHILSLITLHMADMTDQVSLTNLISEVMPHEVYNLAAQSFVHASWDQPIATVEISGVGVTRILEAIRYVDKSIKFYQASSSEMFGKVMETPQSEVTPFYPRSPYACSKVYGHWVTVNFRESYGMFCVSGILFNHESPRRGIEFVTKKITDGVARIFTGQTDELLLGNLEAKRDWGFAGDYVRAMWMMLQEDKPDDYVIATGETHSVAEFCEIAFGHVGLDWHKYVKVDKRFIRPADVNVLCGDYSKARNKLGWRPNMNFRELVESMVDYDVGTKIKILKDRRLADLL